MIYSLFFLMIHSLFFCVRSYSIFLLLYISFAHTQFCGLSVVRISFLRSQSNFKSRFYIFCIFNTKTVPRFTEHISTLFEKLKTIPNPRLVFGGHSFSTKLDFSFVYNQLSTKLILRMQNQKFLKYVLSIHSIPPQKVFKHHAHHTRA